MRCQKILTGWNFFIAKDTLKQPLPQFAIEPVNPDEDHGRMSNGRGTDSMFKRGHHFFEQLTLWCGILLLVSSCTLVEKRIDRSAGGPNVPADTNVQMRFEAPVEPERGAPREIPPGNMASIF